MPITVVGSIAFDTVATPFDRRERMQRVADLQQMTLFDHARPESAR